MVEGGGGGDVAAAGVAMIESVAVESVAVEKAGEVVLLVSGSCWTAHIPRRHHSPGYLPSYST